MYWIGFLMLGLATGQAIYDHRYTSAVFLLIAAAIFFVEVDGR